MLSQSTCYDVRWSKLLRWSIEYCCCSQPHSGYALCFERYHPCFLPRQGCVFHCLLGEYRLLWAHNLFSSQARAPHKPLGNLLVFPRLSIRGHLLPWWACCHLDAMIHWTSFRSWCWPWISIWAQVHEQSCWFSPPYSIFQSHVPWMELKFFAVLAHSLLPLESDTPCSPRNPNF